MIPAARLVPSPAVASKHFRTLARNWELFGRRDPMFGVLSDPTKQHGRWEVDEFFESGRAHVAKLFRTLAAHDAPFTAGRALDFGCGVGRLTRPIAERFEQTIGIDVAPSMIALARRHNTDPARCSFQVNRDPDLRAFQSGTFDFVHSCLVLQHIPPAVSVRYIGEFLRVARPGGLVVFQAPAQAFSEAETDARLSLPPDAYRARIEVVDLRGAPSAGAPLEVHLRVTNEGETTWSADIPGGRHICIANHWLDLHGTAVIADDGRTRLPQDLSPGDTCDVRLSVIAPRTSGDYLLEIDLVQERICWFAQRGSHTARVPVSVRARSGVEGSEVEGPALPAQPAFLARLRRLFEKPAPFFEMHVVPRAEVEHTVSAAGGRVLHAIEDGAAGAGWLSYTYVCRKSPSESLD